jgi:hypothetical protein
MAVPPGVARRTNHIQMFWLKLSAVAPYEQDLFVKLPKCFSLWFPFFRSDDSTTGVHN